MFEFSSTSETPAKPVFPARRRIIVYAAIAALGVGVSGYAIHEHQQAQALVAKNKQASAALDETRHELLDLASKVNVLVARSQLQAAQAEPRSGKPVAAHGRRVDPRFKRLQSQIDAQGKALDKARSEMEGDLASTRTELTGSIAHTHDELVVLEKKGERNFTEFDLDKSKHFERKGPFGVRLRKANVKHQYADMDLIVDDRNLTQKHINLYQPVMFYTPDSPQPVEVVINSISKNHIHGYISAPKYRQSELASMSDGTQNGLQNSETTAGQATPRKRLVVSPQ